MRPLLRDGVEVLHLRWFPVSRISQLSSECLCLLLRDQPPLLLCLSLVMKLLPGLTVKRVTPIMRKRYVDICLSLGFAGLEVNGGERVSS